MDKKKPINLGSIRYTLKREDIMTFVSGLHDVQAELIEASVKIAESKGFPEANEIIKHIMEKK
jgi:hypothetical protein